MRGRGGSKAGGPRREVQSVAILGQFQTLPRELSGPARPAVQKGDPQQAVQVRQRQGRRRAPRIQPEVELIVLPVMITCFKQGAVPVAWTPPPLSLQPPVIGQTVAAVSVL